LISFCAAGLLLGFAGCRGSNSETSPTEAAPKTETIAAPTVKKNSTTNQVAVITTSDGEMVVAFWPDVAPNTVANFKNLAEKGFYDGTAFHRIIAGFMIQGGDPLTKDPTKAAMYGSGGPGYGIKAEFNSRKHERGVISMARSSDPDSAGSQFFICDAPADNPGMQYLNGKYTAFGKLIKGYDVLEKIAKTPVGPNSGGEMSKPLQRVTVESIKIVPADSVKQ
jgi:peptidyl-prolyl cis-trans isomerase B (cyclophilin B)